MNTDLRAREERGQKVFNAVCFASNRQEYLQKISNQCLLDLHNVVQLETDQDRIPGSIHGSVIIEMSARWQKLNTQPLTQSLVKKFITPNPSADDDVSN